MALLLRIAWLLARNIFSLLTMLLLTLIQVLIPITLTVLRWAFNLMTTSIVAMLYGPGDYIERLASEWTRHLLTLGISREHIDTAHMLCRFAAASQIVLGWAIVVIFTVTAFDLIF